MDNTKRATFADKVERLVLFPPTVARWLIALVLVSISDVRELVEIKCIILSVALVNERSQKNLGFMRF